jgi:chromosome segregation ATPase
LSVLNEGDERIRWFISQPVASDNVKKGLQKAMDLRQAHFQAQREQAEVQRQLNVLTEDQKRLRANIAATPSSAAVYKKYLKKLDDQEEQIEKLQASIEKLAAEVHARKKSFDDFLTAFNAD